MDKSFTNDEIFNVFKTDNKDITSEPVANHKPETQEVLYKFLTLAQLLSDPTKLKYEKANTTFKTVFDSIYKKELVTCVMDGQSEIAMCKYTFAKNKVLPMLMLSGDFVNKIENNKGLSLAELYTVLLPLSIYLRTGIKDNVVETNRNDYLLTVGRNTGEFLVAFYSTNHSIEPTKEEKLYIDFYRTQS